MNTLGFQVTIPFLSHLNFWQDNLVQDLNKNNKTFTKTYYMPGTVNFLVS